VAISTYEFNISASVNQRRDNLLFTGINDLQAINSQGNHFYSNYNVFERRLHNKLSFSSNIGIDFLINPKNTISLLADYSHISLSRPSQTNTRFIQLPGNTVDSLYKTFSDNWEKTNFLNNSLIYELRLDSSKKKLTISADFLHYSETRNSCQTTFLSDQQDSLTAIKDHFLSLLPQKIQNATAAIDYSWTGRKISIESGIKYSNSNTDNNVQFQIPNGSQYIVDTSRSNHFKYLERIAGVYFTLKGKFNKKIDYQVGLRYENTFTKGNSVTYDQIKTGNYDNLFHTIFINYIPNKVHQFSFASTSRINRPGFWDINPFRYYTSNTIFVTGNPSLLPSRIYRQEFTYTYKGKFVVQITHSLTKNSFALLNFFQGQEEYQQQTNYGKKESSGINLVYNNRLLPIWFLRLNADLAFLNYDIDLGNKIISQRTHRLEISVLNGLTLSTKKKIYLTSITRNSFMRYSENTRINNQFRTDISAMKVSKDQKWTFTLSVADIFRSAQDKYLTESVSNSFDEKYYYDARNISIGFSYSFGKNSIPNIKQKTIKNQEIKNRVK